MCSVTLNFAKTLTIWVKFFMLCVWLWLNYWGITACQNHSMP